MNKVLEEISKIGIVPVNMRKKKVPQYETRI